MTTTDALGIGHRTSPADLSEPPAGAIGRLRPTLHDPIEAVLRRADSGLDAGATLLALAMVLPIDHSTTVVVIVANVVLAATRTQPLPFRLRQYVQLGRIAPPTVVAVLAASFTASPTAPELFAAAFGTAVACGIGRTGYLALIRWARRTGRLSERALVVGNTLERHGLRKSFEQHPEYGIDVIGELDSTAFHAADADSRSDRCATALVIARGVHLTDQVLSDLRWAVTRGYRVLIETSRTDSFVVTGEVVDLTDAQVVCLPSAPLSYRSWLLKRAFDVAVSTIALVVLSPVLVMTAIGVRVSSPGPIIFRQARIGRGGRPFTMYKFRTFPVGHVDDAFSLSHQDCPLRVGRILRRTSLDELPQLVNVLRGQMSIVGPRPERPHFAGTFAASIPGYHERHRVPGGITGLAQVHGYWGNSDLKQRVLLDNTYIDSWRLRRDFAILLRTIPATVRKGRSG